MQQDEQTQPPETAEDQPGIPPHEVEVMPSLEESLKEAERKAQEHYDAWMYAKAEGENIRRRHTRISTRRANLRWRNFRPNCWR